MVDYKNGKIYRLVGIDGIQYVGSTTQSLAKRKWCHKADWKRGKKCSSVILFEKGEVDIVLLEEYPCENKNQLHSRERHWIETIEGKCVNKQIPTRSSNEYSKLYYEENKDKISEYNKQYYKDNQERIDKKNKQRVEYYRHYYENNKERIRKQQQEYYETHK